MKVREMSQDLRKKIISLHYKGEGKKISKALLISQNTVAKVVQKLKKDETATISQRHPGRPRKLTPRQEHLLMRRVKENRHASSLHKKACLEFARAHADKDEDYWDYILWSDETKINVFGTDGFKTVWRRNGEEYKEKCMVPTVKHGGGSVLMWGCINAAGVRELHLIDGIMNSQMYCSILKEKMLPSRGCVRLFRCLSF
uniref:Sleeping Beauty transposase HTH domain-containing protein n=1 Tax=Sparus aurata TaxID=8175 RepID=A0A671VT84_SPAAU